MKIPKWHAKVFSIIVALAFAVGLVPLAAIPVAADVYCDFYSYPEGFAKVGETVYFYDMSYDGVLPIGWDWDFGDGGTSTSQYPTHQYTAPGTYDVTLYAYFPDDSCSETKYGYITVEWGLITEPHRYPFPNYYPYVSYVPSGIDSQVGYNVIGATGIFWVPDRYRGKVLGWDVSGDGHQYAGGSTGMGYWDMPPGYLICNNTRFDWVEVTLDGIDPGEVTVTAYIDWNGDCDISFTLTATKKWGDINFTELDVMTPVYEWNYDYGYLELVGYDYSECPGESQVMWYEGCYDIEIPDWLGGGYITRCKEHYGTGYLRERVIGTFDKKDDLGTFEHPANGAVVHMFLLDGNAPVHDLPQTEAQGWSANSLLDRLDDLQDWYPPRCVGFYDGDVLREDANGNAIHVTKVSQPLDLNGNGVFEDPEDWQNEYSEMGLTGNMLMAECEEAVKIVFVATYPGEESEELPVFAEICSWNFYTQQMEKIPQVHWAGEKKVLEKQFGCYYAGFPVVFNLENQSCGSLFPIDMFDGLDLGSMASEPRGAQQVLTYCDEWGTARAIVESEKPCECDITCSVYYPMVGRTNEEYSTQNYNNHGPMVNQAGFVVFFLKFEELTLSNMQGERTDHNDGLWDPVLEVGMITSATHNSITDDTKNWDTDEWAGKNIQVWKGEMELDGDVTFIGHLQIREIVSNSADTVDIDPNFTWDIQPLPPEIGSQWYYEIIDPVWDPTVDDLEQELNVSQDALLRVRVKGWFMGDDLSTRGFDPITGQYRNDWCDVNGNGVLDGYDYILPGGRWVLPDDWPYLAGSEWEELRPHWDIMTQPNDNIMSDWDPSFGTPMNFGGLKEWFELGPYFDWTISEPPNEIDEPGALVAQFPVVGPYSELDSYTPYILEPWKIDWKTIIPNQKLNWWDCPMPPAKIIFEILDADVEDAEGLDGLGGAGFFKDVNKGHVYYEYVERDLNNEGPEGIAYTNPYYFMWIPSNPLIPPFNINGGFDWDSWNPAYGGPYPFWKIFNQLPNGETYSEPQNPTKVEVYSDNHGEAMVWLNGLWNLDLSDWTTQWGYDIPQGTAVGTSTVKAIVDYPYFRKHPAIVSNTVEKTWTWGKDVKLFIESIPSEGGDNEYGWKIAWLFVCDPDGFPETGERVEWGLSSGTDAKIIECMGTQAVDWDFIDTMQYKTAWSTSLEATSAEIDKFEEFYGVGSYPEGPYGYAVTWAKLYNSKKTNDDLSVWYFEPDPWDPLNIWKIFRSKQVDFRTASDYDPVLQGPWSHASYDLPYARPLPDAISNILDSVVAVWHENDDGVWEKYIPDAPQAYDNILLQMEPGELYYFRLKDNGTYHWYPDL